MESARPMDRLLVGDVGYGKTEIAVRAAFKAVQSRAAGRRARADDDSRRPARAHLRRAPRRLPGARRGAQPLPDAEGAGGGRSPSSPRGRSTSSSARTACSAPTSTFDDLGLIIVDEEHRFGVKHKERLKQLQARDRRAHAHRDADSAHAAPVARRPARHDADADAAARPVARAHLRRAVGRRADRGGHLRASSIAAARSSSSTTASRPSTASPITSAASCRARGSPSPTARCASASSRRSCTGSSNGEVDVLVSTMIVGVGPRRAEREHDVRQRADTLRARAALPAARPRRPLAPPRVLLSARARRRRSPTPSAGSRCSSTTPSWAPGYRIALKDLELRGAGNLLGPEQSGFVHAVGFDLYLRMLDETVKRLMRGDDAPKLVAGRRLAGHRRPTCPTTTSPSQDAKLDVYRRLARFDDAGRDRGAARRAARPLRAAARRRPRRMLAHGAAAHRRRAAWASKASWCAATRPVLPFATPRSPG